MKMNHETVKTLIKMGELKAILGNIDNEGRIHNNCIALAKNDDLILRTNGIVIYGVYGKGANKVMFTHNPAIFDEPYVQCSDYRTMKPIILNAWTNLWKESNAEMKFEAVKYIILNHKFYRDQLNKVNNNTKGDDNMNTKTTTTVKETKSTAIKTNTQNVMSIAHTIRRLLKLEGDYSAQMKYAMKKAWAIKKGLITMDSVVEQAVVDKCIENTAPEAPVANTKTQEPKTTSVTETKPAPQPTETVEQRFIKFDRVEDKFSIFSLHDPATNTSKPCFRIAGHLKAIAFINLNKNIEAYLSRLANVTFYVNKTIFDKVQINPELRQLCKTRKINLLIEQEAKGFGVSPSGAAV